MKNNQEWIKFKALSHYVKVTSKWNNWNMFSIYRIDNTWSHDCVSFNLHEKTFEPLTFNQIIWLVDNYEWQSTITNKEVLNYLYEKRDKLLREQEVSEDLLFEDWLDFLNFDSDESWNFELLASKYVVWRNERWKNFVVKDNLTSEIIKKYWEFINRVENEKLNSANIEILIRKNEWKERIVAFFNDVYCLNYSLVLLDLNSWEIIYEKQLIPDTYLSTFENQSKIWKVFLIEDSNKIYRINTDNFNIDKKDFTDKISLFDSSYLRKWYYYIEQKDITIWTENYEWFLVTNYIDEWNSFIESKNLHWTLFKFKWMYFLNKKDWSVIDSWNKIFEHLWLEKNSDFTFYSFKSINGLFMLERFKTKYERYSNNLDWLFILFDEKLNLIDYWEIEHGIANHYKNSRNKQSEEFVNWNFKLKVINRNWANVKSLIYYHNWIIYIEEYEITDIRLSKCMNKIELNIDSNEFFDFLINRHKKLINWDIAFGKSEITERWRHLLWIELWVLEWIREYGWISKSVKLSETYWYKTDFYEQHIDRTSWNLEVYFMIKETWEWVYEFSQPKINFHISIDIVNLQNNKIKTREASYEDLILKFKNWDYWIQITKTI